MANSVVRLSIDSHEFDANIKRAGEALNKFFDQAKKGDRTFEVLDDDAMEVIKTFGQLETKSKSANGQLAELTKGFTDLSVIYKRFTDEEKASDPGKILAQQLDELKARITETKAALDFSTQSLNGPQAIKSELRELTQEIANTTIAYRSLSDEERNGATGREMQAKIQQMTERAGTLRDAMDDANRSIKGFSSDTKVFDRISQGVAFLTSSFQTAVGAAKLFGFNIGDNVEVIAKLQAAMAVTNGLTQAQTALQKESALMQGVMAVQAKAAAAAIALEGSNTKAATVAQAAFNAVAKANPYVLLASAVAAVGAALIGFSGNAKKATESIKVETEAMQQAQRMSDIWKNSLSSTFSSLMTKYDELKRQWSELKNEHQKTDWIKNNQTALQNLGGAINDVKSAENFFNDNTDAVVQSFVRRAQAAARVAQLTELYRKQIELLDKKERTQQAITEDAARSGRRAQAGDEIKDSSYWNSRYGSVDREGKWRFSEQGAKLYSGTDTSTADSVVKVDVELHANQSEIDKIKGQITNEFNDVVITPTSNNQSTKTTTTTATTVAKELNPMQQAQKEISALTEEALTADEARRKVIKDEIADLQKQVEEYKRIQDYVMGKETVAQISEVKVNKPLSVSDMIAQEREKMGAQQTALDSNIFSGLLQDSIKNKIDVGTLLDSANLEIQAGIDVPDETWQEILDQYNELRAKIGEEPIKIDLKTGKIDDVANVSKEIGKNMKFAASMTQTLGSAISSIEDPGAKVAATVAQSIATIAMAYSDALAKDSSSKFNIFSFIAAAAAATVSMATTIASIHSATGYASGGIVKGNSYSGDRIGGLVDGNQLVGLNAGEVVLTRAMTGNLASQLSSQNSGGSVSSTPYVTGEKIILGINNYAKKQGWGELVFSRK